jgi:hypothetical protein
MCVPPVATYAQSATNKKDRRELLKVIVATSLVSGLEMFDFTVFGFFAVVIGDQFFPATDPMTSLLLAVGTFGVGWGWRIPFLIGLLIAPVGLYVRRRLREDPIPATTSTNAGTPLAELCREHGTTILLAMLMMMGKTVPVYAIVYYMPSYVTRVMHMPAITGFLSSALSALLLVVIPPLSGLLTDRQPRRKPLALLTSGCTALLVYPVFLMITRANSALPILCGVGLISAVVALGAGVGTLCLCLKRFPRGCAPAASRFRMRCTLRCLAAPLNSS